MATKRILIGQGSHYGKTFSSGELQAKMIKWHHGCKYVSCNSIEVWAFTLVLHTLPHNGIMSGLANELDSLVKSNRYNSLSTGWRDPKSLLDWNSLSILQPSFQTLYKGMFTCCTLNITQRGAKLGNIIPERNSLIICPTRALYMSFINCGSCEQIIFFYNTQGFYMEIVEAKTLYGQRLCGVDSWFSYRGVESGGIIDPSSYAPWELFGPR